MAATTGVAALPVSGSKVAPKKFKGKHSEVESFVYFFERLCVKHRITTDSEKIEVFVHYCSRTVKETLEGLKSFKDKNWTAFMDDFKQYYEAERDKKRFRTADLLRYVKKTEKKRKMKTRMWTTWTRMACLKSPKKNQAPMQRRMTRRKKRKRLTRKSSQSYGKSWTWQ